VKKPDRSFVIRMIFYTIAYVLIVVELLLLPRDRGYPAIIRGVEFLVSMPFMTLFFVLPHSITNNLAFPIGMMGMNALTWATGTSLLAQTITKHRKAKK
jgi:hypothetical protein